MSCPLDEMDLICFGLLHSRDLFWARELEDDGVCDSDLSPGRQLMLKKEAQAGDSICIYICWQLVGQLG
jgi:hypothetical protein